MSCCTLYFGASIIFMQSIAASIKDIMFCESIFLFFCIKSIIAAFGSVIIFYIQTLVPFFRSITLSDVQIITASIQSIFTFLAIIIGGYWTYNLYRVKREGLPRAKVEHNVNVIYASRNRVILSIEVIVENTGPVLLKLMPWQIIVRKMLPPNAGLSHLMEIPLNGYAVEVPPGDDLFARRATIPTERIELEPGEMDRSRYICLINSDVIIISVDSYFENTTKTNIGWKLTTIHDLDKSEKLGCKMQRTELKAGVFPEKGPVETDFEFLAWNLDGNSSVDVKIINEVTGKIELEKRNIQTGLGSPTQIHLKSSSEGLRLEKGAYRFEVEGMIFGGKDDARAYFFVI